MPTVLALYHFEPVANSMKPILCLKEKGLEFASHQLMGSKFEQYSPEFLAINPNGQVPVLVHDGNVITESTVINEYLEDVFSATPLRPADPAARARMRVWTKFVDEYFCPALTVLGAHGARHRAQQIPKDELERILARIPLKEVRNKWATISDKGYSEEELADARYKLGICVTRMETSLSNSEWLAGADYSLADVNIYSFAVALPRVLPEQANETEAPQLLDWIARMNARPAVQAALAMDTRARQG